MPCGLTAPKPSTVQRSTGSSLARRLNRLLSYWPRTGQGVRSALPSSRFARTPRDVRGIAWRISRDGSLCRERVAAVWAGRSSRRRRGGAARRGVESLPRTQSRTTMSALPPTTRWGLSRWVSCGAFGRSYDGHRRGPARDRSQGATRAAASVATDCDRCRSPPTATSTAAAARDAQAAVPPRVPDPPSGLAPNACDWPHARRLRRDHASRATSFLLAGRRTNSHRGRRLRDGGRCGAPFDRTHLDPTLVRVTRPCRCCRRNRLVAHAPPAQRPLDGRPTRRVPGSRSCRLRAMVATSGGLQMTRRSYGLQTHDLVPDRRRAERRQLGRRRLRVGASAAGARYDSRGARGGVRSVGGAAAASSRCEGAPRWGRTPRSV